MRGFIRLAIAAILVAVLASLAGGTAAVAAPTPTPTGTLTLTTKDPAPGAALTFSYSTDRPDKKNWVALYNDPATGPTDEKSHGTSTGWSYVDSTTASGSGTVTIPSTGLTPGHDLVAYFLYADGYTWLAQPVTFRVGYTTTGTLKLTTAKPQAGGSLTFTYTTGKDNAAGKDWVAIYDDPKKSPLTQNYPGIGSTAWSYVSGTSGTVTVPAGALTAGHDVIAYLLYNDGYSWLAEPIVFRLAAASSGPDDSGTLTLLTTDPVAGQPLKFAFTTSTPNATNWIGVYDDPSTMPTGGKSNGASTTWEYVGNVTSGTVTIPAGGLTGGHDVAAVLLYNDGYVNLAPPITFALKVQPPVTGSASPITDHFATDDIVRPAAKPSSAFTYSVGGLWFGVGGKAAAPATFAKQGGPDWVSVSSDGVVSGTTPSAIPAHPPLVTVVATEADGVTGTLTLELPVAEPGAPPTVHAATLTMWDGGTHVDDPVEKLVRSVIVNRFDVVGLQNTGGQAAGIAGPLGWNVMEDPSGLAIIAPYPLTALAAPAAAPVIAAEASVNGTRVNVWDASLDTAGPDPAGVCTIGASAAVAAEKGTKRFTQARAIADAVAAERKASPNARLLLLGELNSPSDLDWTGAAGSANCGAGPVAWPVTKALESSGLTDAFRTARKDAVADPGGTAGILTTAGSTTAPSAAAQRPATLDRLDYIHLTGPITVQNANTVVDGFPLAPPSSAANRWISDRSAVEATLLLAAPPAGGGGTGGGGAGGGAGHAADPHSGSTAGLPDGLAGTGSVLGLIGVALAVAAVLVGGLVLLDRRRRRGTGTAELATAAPAQAAPTQEVKK